MCHLLLGFPVIGLILFRVLPLSLAVALYAALTSFAIVVYFCGYAVMQKRPLCGAEAMVGKRVEVLFTSGNVLKVRYANEIWDAHANAAPRRGEVLSIREVRGLTLIVEAHQ